MSLILITGGARSGKSRWAEQRATELAALSGSPVIFIATAAVLDIEMRLRVAQHRKSRPRGWKTIEATQGVAAALLARGDMSAGAILLLDCVTMLVSNVMTLGDNPISDPTLAQQAVETELRAVLRVVRERKATIIMVTNEVGAGIVPENALSRNYRDIVGRINQWLAGQADGVWLVASGMALPMHTLATPVKQ
jgi:adenosylcobinamide kinase / adenosylcobinamide-phosphate guanylyltransferase